MRGEPRAVDNPEAGRFEALVDERVAGFAGYQRNSKTVALTQTVVDPGFAGRGLDRSWRGAHWALPESRGRSFHPFIHRYIQRHGEDVT